MNKNNSSLRFWGSGTARTFRPIWVAEELGLNYQHHPIGSRTGETQTTEYTLLNPKQKIPYMIDGDVCLSESVAISRYLILKYGSNSTLSHPEQIDSQAKEDEWVSYVYGEIDETSLYVMRRHGELKDIYGSSPVVVASARDYASKHFDVIAAHLNGRRFILDAFGLADIILTSCLDWASYYGFSLPASLAAYREEMSNRDAYRRAFKTNYKDPMEEQKWEH